MTATAIRLLKKKGNKKGEKSEKVKYGFYMAFEKVNERLLHINSEKKTEKARKSVDLEINLIGTFILI